MTTKDLWKIIWLLFKIWLIYVIGKAVLSLFFGWLPGSLGDLVASGIMLGCCVIVFINDLTGRNKKKNQPQMQQNHPNPSAPRQQKVEVPLQKSAPAPKKSKEDYFSRELALRDKQDQRMANRRKMLNEQMAEHFGENSYSASRYQGTVEDAYNLFEKNHDQIDERIRIFDEIGYQNLIDQHLENSEKARPYLQHFVYIRDKLENNEVILEKLEELSIELSELRDDESPDDYILDDLNELVDQTKLYKNR